MLLSDGRKEESKFYAGFSLDEEFTGGFGKFDREEEAFELLPDGTEEYQISEEFETLVGKLEKGKVEVSYDEMME